MSSQPVRIPSASCSPRFVPTLLLLLFAILAASPRLHAQEYSSSDAYKAMMKELNSGHPRPTRLANGMAPAIATAVPLEVKDTARNLTISTGLWQLEIGKAPFALNWTNKQTHLTWRLDEQAGISWAGENNDAMRSVTSVSRVRRQGNRWTMRAAVSNSAQIVTLNFEVLTASIVRFSVQGDASVSDRHLRLQWNAQGPLYGLGERFDRVRMDGVKTTLRPEDLLGHKGHNWTYIPVPLLYTPRGLGLFVDTGEVTSWDLSQPGKIAIALDHTGAETYLLAGDGPKPILGAYTQLTGTTPLSPPWAFGVWICAYGAPEQVIDTARRLREEKIPASGIWTFDAMEQGDIMGWPLWRTGYYPDLPGFTRQLHEMGFKALTYVHPYLRSILAPYSLPSPAFEAAKRDGFLVHDPKGMPTGPRFEPFLDGNLDFTNPKVADWYAKKIQHILVDDGFDGWMEDYGEWINPDDQFASGVRGRQMENLNPFVYHRITYDVAHAAKPDVVGFARSGYAGSQAYTRVVWGGDQFPEWGGDYGLSSVVRAGITAGLSGFSVWCPDIAENGFSKELWIRWMEFGALTSVMRDHPWDKPLGAVNLWSDAETTDAFRRYAQLHVSLFPYLYSFAQDAHRTGLPLMRHPMLEVPNDPKTYDLDDEYYLGDRILVAPVMHEGERTRSLYVPQGDWINYWTGEPVSGGHEVALKAPLEQIPMLVRAGSFLPMLPEGVQTLANDLANPRVASIGAKLVWRVFPAAAATQDSFHLYDGTTAELHQDASTVGLRIVGAPAERRHELVLASAHKPRSVRIGNQNGVELDAAAQDGEGWWEDAGSGMLHIYSASSNFEVMIER